MIKVRIPHIADGKHLFRFPSPSLKCAPHLCECESGEGVITPKRPHVVYSPPFSFQTRTSRQLVGMVGRFASLPAREGGYFAR